jgi:hypothetical protein
MTLKINRVPDSPKDYVCTKFSQNPLKDVDSQGLIFRQGDTPRFALPLFCLLLPKFISDSYFVDKISQFRLGGNSQ